MLGFIAEIAKLNGLNTFYYMKYLFEQLPNIKLDRPEALDHLLPWAEGIPAECRLEKKVQKHESHLRELSHRWDCFYMWAVFDGYFRSQVVGYADLFH